jgi:hypothetical protein
MKHVWNQVRRASGKVSLSASVAAGAVAVMAASAPAESRPGALETEFEFDVAVPGAAAVAAEVKGAAVDLSSAVAKWEQSIGEYLDGLIDDAAPAPEVVQPAVAEGPAVDAVVAADIDAFDGAEPEVKPLPPEVLEALGIDPAEVADGKVPDVLVVAPAPVPEKAEARPAAHAEAAANPLLLAPVLSHPMDCELCREAGKWAEVSEAEPAPGPGEGLVDDMAAWQKLAEWASARVSGDEAAQAGDDVATADEDDDSALAD